MLLNVDVGAGHRRAGEALCQALAALEPAASFRTIEALDYLGAGAGALARDLYLGVQRSIPGLWGAIYGQRGLFDLLQPLSQLVDGVRAEALLPEALRFNPHLLLATHPLACGLGAALRRGPELVAPLSAVLTDLDGHPAWIVDGVDLYLAPSAEAAAALREHGATGEVLDCGIPLREDFAQQRARGDAARTRLGLPTGRLTILMLGGGLGLGPILETTRALAELAGPAVPLQLVLIAGTNAELQREAEQLAQRLPPSTLHATGQVENMADYMAAADLAVGKPGGMTCAELLAMGLPLLALKPLAGQEEANAHVLVRQGAAVRVEHVGEARDALQELLRHPEQLQRMALAASRLGRPTAARVAARRLLALIR